MDTSWTVRPATRDDLGAIVELINRANAFDGIERAVEVDEMDEEFDGERVRYDRDVRVVDGDAAGTLVGYAYTFHVPSDVLEERCFVFGVVDGARRGEGIGSALLQWGIERAAAQLATSDRALPRYVRVINDHTIESATRLYLRHGFTPIRWFDELLRPLDTSMPTVSADLGDVRIVPWPDDRDEDIRAAKNEAFLDHWGSTPTTEASWQRLVRGFGAWPDASFVAVAADGEIVGHCLNHRYVADTALTDRRDGVIDSLGIRRAWRSRGLATALIAHSLRAFAEAGCTHATIEVDSDNPTGAARLYRSLGFEPLRRATMHQIALG